MMQGLDRPSVAMGYEVTYPGSHTVHDAREVNVQNNNVSVTAPENPQSNSNQLPSNTTIHVIKLVNTSIHDANLVTPSDHDDKLAGKGSMPRNASH